jgi:MOB kinase activator 1
LINSIRIASRIKIIVVFSGPKYEYHWADGQTVKKPIKCSAPKYIDYLMTWVQDQLDDESLFPSKIGKLDFD